MGSRYLFSRQRTDSYIVSSKYLYQFQEFNTSGKSVARQEGKQFRRFVITRITERFSINTITQNWILAIGRLISSN